ncbi:MAG TPA: DUF2254 domain-containing protein [Armatimonadaceae bacterium]|nr:DUF2254 domain-containing protein [Armatimonadaceae bacterium]
MNTRLIHVWHQLRSSYWFVPILMSVAAVILARLMLWVDFVVPDASLLESHFLYVGEADAERTVLLTVGTTTLGTAGVVFSLTTVPLSVAASQFGSRLLRNFLRDTTTQVVLGSYFATFIYCMVVLFSIPYAKDLDNLPHIATTVSLGLALFAFCSLVFFVHNIGVTLQAPVVIDGVGDEMDRVVNYYQATLGSRDVTGPEALTEEEQRALKRRAEREGVPVPSAVTGYVHALDVGRLLSLATSRDVVVRLRAHPGDFVGEGAILAYLWPADRADGVLVAEAQGGYLVGRQRILTQDIEFGINQLVEIAVRAMSPAINDPFTAMACLDRLGVILGRIVATCRPWSYRADAAGKARLLYDPITFARLTDTAFHLIRQYSRGNADVLLRMLDAIESVLPHLPGGDEGRDARAALRHHADLAAAEATTAALPNPYDRDRLLARHRAVVATLDTA